MNLSQFIVYILFFIIYLEEDFFFLKDLYWIYKSKDRIGKINNSIKVFRNKPKIIISHS